MGTLFVVATPIGNLNDITFRAIEVLKSVDLILCEDTRVTSRLTAHYAISKPMQSFFAGNESKKVAEVCALLRKGESIALVTDAGTPCISDPGYLLVRACREEGIPVVPVPGASALVTALSASGLPGHRILFLGFPPRKAGERRRLLEGLRDDPSTLVFYEAPHRIRSFLKDGKEQLTGRKCVVERELTKYFETIAVVEEPETVKEKGEFVVIFGPPAKRERKPLTAEAASRRVAELLASGKDEKAAIKALAKENAMAKREVYNLVKVKVDESEG